MNLVLPPVPTVGLTIADVAQLAVTVREQMLAALHEISDASSGSSPQIPKPSAPQPSASTPVPPAPPPTAVTTAEKAADVEAEGSAKVAPLSIDTASVAASADSSSIREASDKADTEDDEMVLVDRPSSDSGSS